MSESQSPPHEVTEEKARRYARRRQLMALGHLLVGLAFLVVMLLWFTQGLAAFAERTVSGTFSQVSLYTLVFLLFYQVVIFPLDYYRFLLEHQFGLSTQSFGAWLWQKTKQVLLSTLLLVLMVEFIYLVLRWAPEHWWVYAGAGWIAVTVVLSRLFPVVILPLFYRSQPLADAELGEQLRGLAAQAGLSIKGVYTFNLSRETRKANAALVGWASTRRVLLADTLLEHFKPTEVEAIFAHELGHHVDWHVLKETVLGGAAAMLGFALCQVAMEAVAPRLGFAVDNIASLPLLALLLMVFAVVLLPLQNGYSRRLERRSDIYAVRHASEPRALLTAFAKLARLNLVQRRPHRIIELLLYSHPPIEKRMAYIAREIVRIEGIRPSGDTGSPSEPASEERA